MLPLHRIAVLLLLPLAASTATHATDILFVGNSFTFGYSTYNAAAITDANGTGHGGVPALFKKLATEGGHSNVNVTIEALSGQTLAYHYANKSHLIGKRWDWVVLQEYSTGPLVNHPSGNVPAFRTAVQNLAALVRAHNPSVRILLYEAWARPDQVGSGRTLASMQAELGASNSEAAADFSLHGWVPAGDAFMQAITDGVAYDPNGGAVSGAVNLWNPDRYHANAYGAYLTSLVFYNRILSGDPRQLPTGPGSAVAGLGLNAASAAKLQQVAAKFADLIIVPPPSITTHPASVAVWPGSNANFKVVAQGSGLAYQWRRNGSPIPGATGNTLTVAHVEADDTGRYDVVVTNTAGDSLVSAPAALTLADRTSVRRFLIDFGSSGAGYVTAGSDFLGRRWNHFTDPALGSQLPQLIDTTGVAHPAINVFVASAFAGVNTSGHNDEVLYPAAAQRDSFFVTGYGSVAGSSRGEITFAGLRSDAHYSFTLFASRAASGQRVARYTIAGYAPVYLDAAFNSQFLAALGHVSPTQLQSLSLVVEPRDPDGVLQEYGYLGVVDMTESTPAASSFATWASLCGLSGSDAGADADPDLDGLPNLLEYALGGAPLAPGDSARFPAASVAIDAGSAYLSLTIDKNPQASGITYRVEVSADLQTWSSGPAHTTVLAETASILRVRDNTPGSAQARRFMRLRVLMN